MLRRLTLAGSLYLGAIALLAFCGLPLLWMLYSAFKPAAELFTYPPRVLGAYDLANFVRTLALPGKVERCR